LSKNTQLSEDLKWKEWEKNVNYWKEMKPCEGLMGQVKWLSELVGGNSGNSSEGLHVIRPGNTGIMHLWMDIGRKGTCAEGGYQQDWAVGRAII
jgi:hypothetical protein